MPHLPAKTSLAIVVMSFLFEAVGEGVEDCVVYAGTPNPLIYLPLTAIFLLPTLFEIFPSMTVIVLPSHFSTIPTWSDEPTLSPMPMSCQS